MAPVVDRDSASTSHTFWEESRMTGWTIRRDNGTLRISGMICDSHELYRFVTDLMMNHLNYLAGGELDRTGPTLSGESTTPGVPIVRAEPRWCDTPTATPFANPCAHTITAESAAREALRTRDYVEPYRNPFAYPDAALCRTSGEATAEAPRESVAGTTILDAKRWALFSAGSSLLRRLARTAAFKSIEHS